MKKSNKVMLIALLLVIEIVINTNQQPTICYGECTNRVDITMKFI